MQNNLQQKLIKCESHVTTRLRYAPKLEENFGSPNKVEILQMSIEQYEYVVNVITDLNAPNGVSITKDLVSGVV